MTLEEKMKLEKEVRQKELSEIINKINFINYLIVNLERFDGYTLFDAPPGCYIVESPYMKKIEENCNPFFTVDIKKGRKQLCLNVFKKIEFDISYDNWYSIIEIKHSANDYRDYDSFIKLLFQRREIFEKQIEIKNKIWEETDKLISKYFREISENPLLDEIDIIHSLY